MSELTRRNFLKLAGGSALGLGLAGCVAELPVNNHSGKRVVVVGGGFGGATAAKYLSRFDPNIQVTLVEPNPQYYTGPASNWVLGGLRTYQSIALNYEALHSRHGVQVVQDQVIGIDPTQRTVRLQKGDSLPYDRLIMAPGIDFRWQAIEGYDEKVSADMPHAWRGGPQLELLHKQLLAMKNGGLVVISIPAPPYSGMAAPYERASLIAHYLKQHKPKSKILLLDASDSFADETLFRAGWKTLYKYGKSKYGSSRGLIEWMPASKGGTLHSVSAKTRVLRSAAGTHWANVANVIPPQQAAAIAIKTGLSDASGWCPVNPRTWESRRIPGIHVIGDACYADPLPKTGFAANSAAKVCAAAVVALLNERAFDGPSWVNTSYSLIGPQYAISNAMVYKLDAQQRLIAVAGAGGPSAESNNKQLESVYADSWYQNLTADAFG